MQRRQFTQSLVAASTGLLLATSSRAVALCTIGRPRAGISTEGVLLHAERHLQRRGEGVRHLPGG